MKKSKHGDYQKRVFFEVYSFFVYIVFTDDLQKSVTSRYPGIDVDGSEAMHCRETGKPESHLFFQVGNCDMGTVAHECWHAIRYLLDDWTGCGIHNESIAYHLGFLVEKVSDFRDKLIDSNIGVTPKSSTKKR